MNNELIVKTGLVDKRKVHIHYVIHSYTVL